MNTNTLFDRVIVDEAQDLGKHEWHIVTRCAGTRRRVWAFADELKLPRIIYVSKMEKERSNFYGVVEQVTKTFDVKATPVFLPIGAEDKFEGLVDLIKMKAYRFAKDGSGKFEESDVPADMKDEADEWREKMIENIVEADDQVMEKYLDAAEKNMGRPKLLVFVVWDVYMLPKSAAESPQRQRTRLSRQFAIAPSNAV